jgi:DNA-binding IclR family transcriptional regulator
MAYMNEKEQEQYLSENDLPYRTPNTMTDYNQLKKELSSIRRDGYSVDDEENELGVRCIAAPVRDHNGIVIAVVSISGPSTRMTIPKIRQLEPMLKECVSDITRAIGYQAESLK